MYDKTMDKELEQVCTCGCPESMHVDGMEHCVACIDCKEFEEETIEATMDDSTSDDWHDDFISDKHDPIGEGTR